MATESEVPEVSRESEVGQRRSLSPHNAEEKDGSVLRADVSHPRALAHYCSPRFQRGTSERVGNSPRSRIHFDPSHHRRTDRRQGRTTQPMGPSSFLLVLFVLLRRGRGRRRTPVVAVADSVLPPPRTSPRSRVQHRDRLVRTKGPRPRAGRRRTRATSTPTRLYPLLSYDCHPLAGQRRLCRHSCE